MEISRNVRGGFLGWRNERGHRVLNNALEPILVLSPLSFSIRLLSLPPRSFPGGRDGRRCAGIARPTRKISASPRLYERLKPASRRCRRKVTKYSRGYSITSLQRHIADEVINRRRRRRSVGLVELCRIAIRYQFLETFEYSNF